jgi:hypothetical protein
MPKNPTRMTLRHSFLTQKLHVMNNRVTLKFVLRKESKKPGALSSVNLNGGFFGYYSLSMSISFRIFNCMQFSAWRMVSVAVSVGLAALAAGRCFFIFSEHKKRGLQKYACALLRVVGKDKNGDYSSRKLYLPVKLILLILNKCLRNKHAELLGDF